MKRNLKALGLAFLAAFAMSAVAASAAQAENRFTADSYPVSITGEQEHDDPEFLNKFEISGNNYVTCTKATFEGTAEEAVTTLTIQAEYHDIEDVAECETSLGSSAKVDMNGCDFTFFAGEHLGEHEFAGEAAVDCPQDKEITVTIPTSGSLCDIHIPTQGHGGGDPRLTGITYTNLTNEVGSADDEVTVDVDITNQITYSVTKTSIFCPLTAGHFDDGSYVSKAILQGYKDPSSHEAGDQKGIRVSTP